MSIDPCWHCTIEISGPDADHRDEHPGLCCDCFDLSWGMPLSKLNEERRAKGRPDITKEWPCAAGAT